MSSSPPLAARSSRRVSFSTFLSVLRAVFSAPTPGLWPLAFLRLSRPLPMLYTIFQRQVCVMRCRCAKFEPDELEPTPW